MEKHVRGRHHPRSKLDPLQANSWASHHPAQFLMLEAPAV